MQRRTRRPLSGAETAELWRRWREGDSLSDISRSLDRKPGSIYRHLTEAGGFPPAPRRRNPLHLSSAEREEISRGLCAGCSLRSVAEALGRAPSTVSREVRRNGGRKAYRANAADSRAQEQARRPKPCKLGTHARLRHVVAAKLRLEWSPEQIAGWLRARSAHDEMNVSHETIYKSLFVQSRGVLNKELRQHLRTRRKLRRSQHASTRGQPRGQIIDAVAIRERPAEAADRAIPGHWEGDLLTGARNTHIATLVERRSRFTMLVQVDGKDTESVVKGLVRQVRKLPAELRRTLTWDRGMELARHKDFSIATDAQVFFCDPQSPWQRGTNENTNRLLRQYFPYGMELSSLSQADLNKVARRLNQRPRKTLGFKTPADIFSDGVALTG